MPPEGCTKAGILPGCPNLDRGSRGAEVGFEPRTLWSVNSRSNRLGHLTPCIRNRICVSTFISVTSFPDVTALLPPLRYLAAHNHTGNSVAVTTQLLLLFGKWLFGRSERVQWLEREFTDRKVRGLNPTSASRLFLSRLEQPGSVPALVLASGGISVRHRKCVTARRLSIILFIESGNSRPRKFRNLITRVVTVVPTEYREICRRIRNEAIRKRVFGRATGTSIEEYVQHQKLRWLGHVLSMPNHRLPKRVLFSMPNSEWRKQRGGQPLTWKRGMKEITKRLGAVGATRLPGWGPHDPHCAWLETLQDMAANRYCLSECLGLLSNKSWLYSGEASVSNIDVMLSMMMKCSRHSHKKTPTQENAAGTVPSGNSTTPSILNYLSPKPIQRRSRSQRRDTTETHRHQVRAIFDLSSQRERLVPVVITSSATPLASESTRIPSDECSSDEETAKRITDRLKHVSKQIDGKQHTTRKSMG
ncbi:hypothetical protein T265_06344 [Opisthorchis viverrini]|uniref:Uncharacterized protein n=1 Tax=Opisthorchis viverrini TaxID=6198 RepID=A0A075AE08_OPIVI|nr:hypothetical protein T265_06344 [Opisthorchis viverrini]KER26429.1 hypothetical protein T265_06344 [Opisthorchis viverrini]